jgi:hypothetical protein
VSARLGTLHVLADADAPLLDLLDGGSIGSAHDFAEVALDCDEETGAAEATMRVETASSATGSAQSVAVALDTLRRVKARPVGPASAGEFGRVLGYSGRIQRR